MKNSDFFYLQYNNIDWKNQEKTKLNSFINDYIIQNIVLHYTNDSISFFDIGFGIGFFFRMLIPKLQGRYKKIFIAGCEPSHINYDYFLKEIQKCLPEGVAIKSYEKTFQDVVINKKFDFITAIYVFPHFLAEDMDGVIKKIYSMLTKNGKFILVLAEEKYLENKLKNSQDLYIEKNNIIHNNKWYKELLHYSNIPSIGKIIDYNREESYYLDMFKDNNFILTNKENLEDNGFICTLFVFEQNK